MHIFKTKPTAAPLGHESERVDARGAYRIAVDPERRLPREVLAAQLHTLLAVSGDEIGSRPSDLIEYAQRWSRQAAARHSELFDRYREDNAVYEVLVRRTVLGCAPLASMAGAWLQWLTCSGTCEDEFALRTLALYATDLGAGHARRSRGQTYLSLMRATRLSDYAEPIARLAADPRIPDRAFTLPATLLLASRLPSEFTAEIIGADLCLRAVATLPALAPLATHLPTATDWVRLAFDTAPGEEGPGALRRCLELAETLAADPDRAVRMVRGFRWALYQLEEWDNALFDELHRACDPAVEMAELVRARAREAHVYHHDFVLAGRSLSDWFTEARTDPGPLVRALADSRLIRPGRPDASPLITTLVAENGRMFRVFTDNDLAVIRRWIAALPTETPAASNVGRSTPPPPLSLIGLHRPHGPGATPMGIREAYHLLHAREQTDALHHYAAGYVRNWLDRVRETEVHLPTTWEPTGLRTWLLDQHDRHAVEYDSCDEPLPTREELIVESVQLAPMILIDGAWLQGFTDYSLASTEIGFSLFATYWDELGNSELRLNHPLIYRRLLGDMGINLPPTASKEFADWDGFDDKAFAVPVYWLSLSRYPQSFVPELLGLNLAIELSGVGGTYRRMRRSHASHGFDTRFIDIHSTIDNVSTGHSAWASDAVDIYLATVTGTGGAGAADQAWQRVRTGYAALDPVAIGL
ncbi:iron-containing redox enzyme family protein [Nocardia fluminea]|uniref:iron-containing redox enzyme family protein n=1 Tax=Nocardia fluminea TaxID=134984 RepID=UPI0034427FBE